VRVREVCDAADAFPPLIILVFSATCSAACADYATMVNRGDATGSDEWRELPIDQQMAFRIPISVMVNTTHLRNRQPVITASEYLRLHDQDPDNETSDGFWHRDLYHTQANIFETNKTRTPSLFVIEKHWYGPQGTHRVDYIPEAMKRRGNLDLHPGQDNYHSSAEYWPPVEPTELSGNLLLRGSSLDWRIAKSILVNSLDLVGDLNLGDDEAVEEVLNAHGWEVLHTFPGLGVPLFLFFAVTTLITPQALEWSLLRSSWVMSDRLSRARPRTITITWMLTLSSYSPGNETREYRSPSV
jgi:hypothetical protein